MAWRPVLATIPPFTSPMISSSPVFGTPLWQDPRAPSPAMTHAGGSDGRAFELGASRRVSGEHASDAGPVEVARGTSLGVGGGGRLAGGLGWRR